MTTESRTLIRNAICRSMSDDLERAQNAFRGLSEKQMQEQYGASGQTRQQILDGYRRDRDMREAALKEFNALS